jgi:hypothetical protein
MDDQICGISKELGLHRLISAVEMGNKLAITRTVESTRFFPRYDRVASNVALGWLSLLQSCMIWFSGMAISEAVHFSNCLTCMVITADVLLSSLWVLRVLFTAAETSRWTSRTGREKI